MVKTPKTRHSRSRREPVTIDLDPADVSRVGGKDQADTDKQPEQVAGAQSQAPETESPNAAPADASESSTATSEDKTSQSRGFDYDFGESDARPQPTAAEAASEATKATDQGKTDGGFVNDQPAEAKRAGVGTLAAGVIGGVVALAGMGILQAAGLFGTSDTAAKSEIAALKSEVAALKSNSNSDGSAQLAAALDQVKTDVAALKTAPAAGADEGRVKALADNWTQRADPAFFERASGAIIVLLVFLLAMNLLAIYLRRRFERRW